MDFWRIERKFIEFILHTFIFIVVFYFFFKSHRINVFTVKNRDEMRYVEKWRSPTPNWTEKILFILSKCKHIILHVNMNSLLMFCLFIHFIFSVDFTLKERLFLLSLMLPQFKQTLVDFLFQFKRDKKWFFLTVNVYELKSGMKWKYL